VSRRIVILDSAQGEFRDIQKHVQRAFGTSVWREVLAEYKASLERIQHNPEAGSPIDELKEVGIANVRFRLVRQTRVVYAFDDSRVIVHMFIHTRRDFRTHLLKRLLD